MDKKNYILFGLACGILLTALYLYQWNVKKTEEHNEAVDHTLEVIAHFEKLASDIKGVLIFPAEIRKNHKNRLLEYENYDSGGVQESVREIARLTRDNLVQQKRLDTLQTLIDQHVMGWLQRDMNEEGATLETSPHIKALMLIQYNIDKGVGMERELLKKRREEFRTSQQTTTILRMVFMGVGLLIIAVITISNIYQITKRTQAEAFLSSVLNTSPTGILAAEAIRDKQEIKDFKIIFSNHALRGQLELKDGEVLKETLLQISPDTVERGTFAKYVEVTEIGKNVEFEAAVKRDSHTRWFQLYINKLNDGFIASYSEITELKKSQQLLQQKIVELQRTNSELEQFAYVASHDLQEPLRKIKTFSSLIVERFNDPAASFAKVYLNKVINAANRMSTLINDLLNFSSLSDQREQFVETDLNKLLDKIYNDFELTIQEKKAVIAREPLQNIEAVPLQMNQLFYNLLNNALKFAKPDMPVAISITARLLSTEEVAAHRLYTAFPYQEIVIKDNGIGFNQEYAEKIFVIFQRLNSKEAFAGTGIGLALCQKIVLNHHGIIYAESKDGEGASFHVILPLRQPVIAGKLEMAYADAKG
ncbi:MAG: hypothetical protein INR73_14745 [Williamsia sp.]|nr:hypothetical protein [Williamsia sp.]